MFRATHQTMIEEIKRRQKKITSAEAKGAAWDVIKSEAERDFSSLFDDLAQINEKLDVGGMRGK